MLRTCILAYLHTCIHAMLLPGGVQILHPSIQPHHQPYSDIDPAVIYEYLARAGYVVPGNIINVAFLGCGCAQSEIQLLQHIMKQDCVVKHAVFLDHHLSSATIHNIQQHMPHHNGTLYYVATSYHDLTRCMCRGSGVWLVIGIHATFAFASDDAERHEYYKFLQHCHALASQQRVQPELLNFQTSPSSEMYKVPTHVHLLKQDADSVHSTWVHRTAWTQHIQGQQKRNDGVATSSTGNCPKLQSMAQSPP